MFNNGWSTDDGNVNVELGWYSQQRSCGVSRKTPAEYQKQGCVNYGPLTRTVWDFVNSLTIFWKRQNQSCACAQRHCWLFLTHRSMSRSEQLSKTDERHASTCTGSATTCNDVQHLATAGYGLQRHNICMQRYPTPCKRMQCHTSPCIRVATACVGMHRPGLFMGLLTLKFGSHVLSEKKSIFQMCVQPQFFFPSHSCGDDLAEEFTPSDRIN